MVTLRDLSGAKSEVLKAGREAAAVAHIAVEQRQQEQALAEVRGHVSDSQEEQEDPPPEGADSAGQGEPVPDELHQMAGSTPARRQAIGATSNACAQQQTCY